MSFIPVMTSSSDSDPGVTGGPVCLFVFRLHITLSYTSRRRVHVMTLGVSLRCPKIQGVVEFCIMVMQPAFIVEGGNIDGEGVRLNSIRPV